MQQPLFCGFLLDSSGVGNESTTPQSIKQHKDRLKFSWGLVISLWFHSWLFLTGCYSVFLLFSKTFFSCFCLLQFSLASRVRETTFATVSSLWFLSLFLSGCRTVSFSSFLRLEYSSLHFLLLNVSSSKKVVSLSTSPCKSVGIELDEASDQNQFIKGKTKREVENEQIIWEIEINGTLTFCTFRRQFISVNQKTIEAYKHEKRN